MEVGIPSMRGEKGRKGGRGVRGRGRKELGREGEGQCVDQV